MINYLSEFFRELKRRNTLLFFLGVSLFFMFVVFLAGFIICDDPLFKVCHWLKPFKFTASFALYVFTIGWILEYLKESIGEKKIRQISRWIASLIIIEVIVVMLQSWQASDSYMDLQFSAQTTEYLSKIFHFIGNVTILINTMVAVYICFCFFRNIHLKPFSYLLGIRVGLLVFIVSCILGVFLLGHYGQVPPDPVHIGLPFTHLSSLRSNLITIHFMGIHYLQLLPLCGYFIPDKKGIILILSLAVVYVCLCGYAVYLAL